MVLCRSYKYADLKIGRRHSFPYSRCLSTWHGMYHLFIHSFWYFHQRGLVVYLRQNTNDQRSSHIYLCIPPANIAAKARMLGRVCMSGCPGLCCLDLCSAPDLFARKSIWNSLSTRAAFDISMHALVPRSVDWWPRQLKDTKSRCRHNNGIGMASFHELSKCSFMRYL